MNADSHEISKFDAIAHRWWDLDGDFKPLHAINPLRLNYIDDYAHLSGKTVLDIGCGGGILAESMARRGAHVTGIDLSPAALSVARLHALDTQAAVDYRHISAEDLATEMPEQFDIVTCMEMLEHVPDPASIVRACAQLAKPGGSVFFSTINRNPKAFMFAIVGAEYILQMLPQGTHEYEKFIRPSELELAARQANLTAHNIIGLSYNPIFQNYRLSKDIDINYLVYAIKEL